MYRLCSQNLLQEKKNCLLMMLTAQGASPEPFTDMLFSNSGLLALLPFSSVCPLIWKLPSVRTSPFSFSNGRKMDRGGMGTSRKEGGKWGEIMGHYQELILLKSFQNRSLHQQGVNHFRKGRQYLLRLQEKTWCETQESLRFGYNHCALKHKDLCLKWIRQCWSQMYTFSQNYVGTRV